MTYKQSVDYIHSLLKFGIKPGLLRISALTGILGNPQNNLKFIHVAGTNGKGSTASMMSEILKSAGYKTGLFMSPYVFDFCERIQINNENISHSDLSEITAEVKSAVDKLAGEGIEPTEFEVITAVALLYFYRQKCDYVVLEVGLGGRFDSTNVIPAPVASIITSISLDHTKILGDTIEQIAFEKCGIIKHGSKVITTTRQDSKAIDVIKNAAASENCDLIIGDVNAVEIFKEDIFGTDICFNGIEIHIPLVGRHQIENAVGVITTAKALNIDDKYIKTGIESTIIHARMEIIEKSPVVMLDGGHNPECGKALAEVLENFAENYKITVLTGMMADKDCEKYLAEVLPYVQKCIVTVPRNSRSLAVADLSLLAKKYLSDVEIIENPTEAYDFAKAKTDKSAMLLVCGSFYLLSDIFKK